MDLYEVCYFCLNKLSRKRWLSLSHDKHSLSNRTPLLVHVTRQILISGSALPPMTELRLNPSLGFLHLGRGLF